MVSGITQLVVGLGKLPRNGLARIVSVTVVHERTVVAGVVQVDGRLEDVTAGRQHVAVVDPLAALRVVAHLLPLLQKQRFVVLERRHSAQSRILKNMATVDHVHLPGWDIETRDDRMKFRITRYSSRRILLIKMRREVKIHRETQRSMNENTSQKYYGFISTT